jgi:hypothetical protein
MSRLPHASRATIAAKYLGGQDISLAYLRECFILDPVSPSGIEVGASANMRPEWNARYTGKPAGSPNGKRIFPDPPYLGWPEALSEGARHRLADRPRRALPQSPQRADPAFSGNPSSPLGHVGVAGRQPSPAGGTCDPGGICLSEADRDTPATR